MKTLKDYHDLYLKCDALLLADSPGLSWDAMLKMTIKLELITDPDMYIFIEKGTRVEFLVFLKDIVKSTVNI